MIVDAKPPVEKMASPLNLVIIGASTGGTRILPVILRRLKQLRACVIIVQHMPEFINASFANSLAMNCVMPVRLARDSDRLQNGTVLIVPGAWHCSLSRNNTAVHLWQGEKVNFVCPSIDVTMLSILPLRPHGMLMGIILTGMGRDGANGIVHVKKLGGMTIAQEKNSCAVYGMPNEAVKTGCVDLVLPPNEIGDLINRTFA